MHEVNDAYDVEEEAQLFCYPCQIFFTSQHELFRHRASGGGSHHWCFGCSKDFHCAVDLEEVPLAPLRALFLLPVMLQRFQAAAIAHHVENGACPNAPVSRHQVTHAVHALNISPTISIRGHLHYGDPAPYVSNVIEYAATEQAWNGSAYELCYLCQRTFWRLRSLNEHLRSPAHDHEEFQCPQTSCGRTFTVVSALVQHIESEACGVARFEEVARHATAWTDSFARRLVY
ncbi:hypothetical protein OF83DRAFT_1178661 [Amylostereum chailletii]|nr:hypothetical protein OF83DRAFT_1178661 [Amylostereum chailletii]